MKCHSNTETFRCEFYFYFFGIIPIKLLKLFNTSMRILKKFELFFDKQLNLFKMILTLEMILCNKNLILIIA